MTLPFQEQEAQEQPPAEALAEAQMRGVRKAQQSILEDRLGATAAELGTAAAFATLDRLPRSMVRDGGVGPVLMLC